MLPEPIFDSRVTNAVRAPLAVLLSIRHVRIGNRLRPHHWISLSYWCMLIYFATIILTFKDYGITFDEVFNITYAEHIIHWYSTFFADRQAID